MTYSFRKALDVIFNSHSNTSSASIYSSFIAFSAKYSCKNTTPKNFFISLFADDPYTLHSESKIEKIYHDYISIQIYYHQSYHYKPYNERIEVELLRSERLRLHYLILNLVEYDEL
jgi:hypothetical protein